MSMQTILLKADAPETVEQAAAILKQGGLVAIPTETVYGLGANGLDAQAVHKIFEAKGRPQDNPLILHIAEIGQLEDICHDTPKEAYTLAEQFWPGPLTLVLPCRELVPRETTAGLPTVAVRCPANAVTRRIIAAAGVPVAAPSGNRSGRPSPTTAAHMVTDMDGRIDAIVDGGPCGVGVESTILDLTTRPFALLRPGGLPVEAIEAVVGPILVDGAVTGTLKPGQAPKAPGMKYRHYAPKAPVIVVCGRPDLTAKYIAEHTGADTGVICFDEFSRLFSGKLQRLGPSWDQQEQARRLFDALRWFDTTDVTCIYAQCPEETGLGRAVVNRLKKAAGFQTVTVELPSGGEST